MAGNVSAKRYAQAVFELGLERDRLDQWAAELELVEGVLQDDEFKALLKHAGVPAADKVKAVDSVLGQTEPAIRNVVNLLVARGLVDVIADLRAAYVELLDQHLGRQRVQVTSAVPLEQEELDRISRFMSSLVRKEVVLSADVDESILGGMVVQIGDRLLDGSTASRLRSLRNRINSEIVLTGS